MVRSVVLLLVGAVAGSAIVWQLQLRSTASHDPSAEVLPIEPIQPVVEADTDPVADPTEDVASATVPTPESTAPVNAGFATQRLAIYQSVAGASDVTQLESMIRVASVAPDSRLRDLELSVLLARLAEFDPARAIEFARQMYLESDFHLPLYRQWASIDAVAAIRSLMLVSPASVQREIALEILSVTGFDSESVVAVAVALPEQDRKSFELDALVRQAELDPAGAIDGLNAVDDATNLSQSVARLAESVALRNPDDAMALAALIDDASAQRWFRSAVANAWATSDPERAFALLEVASEAELLEISSVLVTLAASDASRAMTLAEELPMTQTYVRAQILAELAQQDPNAASDILARMPVGQERESFLTTVAQARGRSDPDGALAWVRSLDPPSQSAMAGVLQGIADVDFDRAVDLVMVELDSLGPGAGMTNASTSSYLNLMFSITRNSSSSNREQFTRLADRILDSGNRTMQSMMSSAISQWARTDPDAAIDWIVTRGDKLDASAFSNMATQMAQLDPQAALSSLNLMPAAQRGSWLEGALTGLARNDIGGAVAQLNQFRGQDGYEEAYAGVAREMSRTDPERAARMLDDAPESQQITMAALNISREWATRDPLAAANWAARQTSEQVRNNSLGNVMGVWAQRDAAEARRWAMQLSSGTDRDAALRGYMSTLAQTGEFDSQLIAAFSDKQAGQQAAASAIVNIGRTDPERASQLLNEYIQDENIRRNTERNLAANSGTGAGMFISNGGIIFMN